MATDRELMQRAAEALITFVPTKYWDDDMKRLTKALRDRAKEIEDGRPVAAETVPTRTG